MKYFTKEWCKEMHALNFLLFPRTLEEWKEAIDSYTELGIDYIKINKEELERYKAELLGILPEYFHSYIYDGSLNTEFPTPELRKMSEQWTKETMNRAESMMKEYNDYYESIKDLLPPNLKELKSLHDSKIISYKKESDDTFIITLDCSGSFNKGAEVKYTFIGVKTVIIPNNLTGRWWLYDEMYPTDNGFELRVLFDDMTELHVVGENLLIEELARN